MLVRLEGWWPLLARQMTDPPSRLFQAAEPLNDRDGIALEDADSTALHSTYISHHPSRLRPYRRSTMTWIRHPILTNRKSHSVLNAYTRTFTVMRSTTKLECH